MALRAPPSFCEKKCGGVAVFLEGPHGALPFRKKKKAEGRGAVRRPHTTFMGAAQLVAIQISMPSVAAQRMT